MLTGPKTRPGKPAHVINIPGSEPGPNSEPMTYGIGVAQNADAFGLNFHSATEEHPPARLAFRPLGARGSGLCQLNEETPMRPRLTFANVASAIAVFIALGGTAIATHPGGQNTISTADIINGEVKNGDLAADAVASGKIQDRQVKNTDLSIGASSSNTIADGGIQGIDVKSDTLTGTQIAESSLGKVPDADTLDGKDSASFMEGQALYNRVVQSATGGFTGDILVVPGFGTVFAGCESAGARTVFHNTTADPIHVWVDDGSDDPGAVVLPGGGGSTTLPTAPKPLDRVIFQVGRGTATDADFRLATIVVTSSGDGSQCIYQAQAVAQSK